MATITCMITIFLAALALILVAPSASGAGLDTNVLISGDVLGTEAQLSNPVANFVMQGDCNLVLYTTLGGGFQSNTHNRGRNCTLTLSDSGQLIIRNGAGNSIWASPNSAAAKRGTYAAVLRPDGQVAVYGSIVMSTPPAPAATSSSALSHTTATNLVNPAKNLLFSGDILSSNNAQLSTRDYTFVLRDDCNLAAVKGSKFTYWTSETEGKGKHCFVRLSHRGELVVADDDLHVIWSSGSSGDDGEYVLVLQINSQVGIFGPIVWSTAPSSDAAAAKIQLPSSTKE